MTSDQVLIGHPSLGLRATLDASDANLYAELIDVAPDGTETVVNDGFLQASHRRSDARPSPVPVDRPVDLEIPIRASHHRFAAGHRVRLRISGGASATLTAVAQPVSISITTGAASTLELPGFASDAG
jgi:predicted acyl esterase